MAAPWFDTIRQPLFRTGGMSDAYLPNPTKRYDQQVWNPYGSSGGGSATEQQANALEQPAAAAPEKRPDFYGLGSYDASPIVDRVQTEEEKGRPNLGGYSITPRGGRA